MQKKRLEYIMRQSEMYTGFIAGKMGMEKEDEREKEVFVNG